MTDTPTRLAERILPQRLDNGFSGRKTALWLLGMLVALKLVMSVNSLAFTATIARNADGFPLDTYGADGAAAVLMLFAMIAVGQLALALVGLAALVRYRAMVPMVYLLLLAEQVGRRLVVQSYAIERAQAASAGTYVNAALLGLLLVGLGLSLWRRPEPGG